MQQEKLDSLLEDYCQQGCREVNNIIAQLENQHAPKEMQELSDSERQYVHSELKAIMDVYDGYCSM